MIARVLVAVLLLGASSAVAAEKSVTIKGHDAAAATVKVPEDATVTTNDGKTSVDTKTWTVHLWVVPDSDTVEKAVPKIAKLVESEVKQFAVDRTEPITVAGAEGKHLFAKGIEADDSDPATAEVVVFAVGNNVLAACVHGEGQRAQQWRPAMLEILKTVAKP